jgi:beta-galactosidase GanA
MQTADERDTESLSPFSSSVRDADARAFAQLMRHLREADAAAHTVLLVQVENEVGVIPESRDHSQPANSAFAAPVPTALTDYFQKHRSSLNPDLRATWEAAGAKTAGDWREVFGKSPLTDDLFMAWQFAAYIQQIVSAGKAEYPLPMYANAALIRPNYLPGQYNSGGPLPHSIDIWSAAAPALDFYSPDIYFNEFAFWAGSYARPGNPLFIPEAQGGLTGAANALYAFGSLSAFGFSPFGIDDQGNTPLDLVGITNPSEHPDSSAIGNVYEELSRLAPTILKAQQAVGITSALIETDAQRSARISIGEYTATMTRSGPPSSSASRVGAMFIQVDPNEFLIFGSGDATITFSTEMPGPPDVGIESIDEEYYENGSWVPRRRLNGDESSQGHSLRLYSSDLSQGRIFRVRLYRYR